MIDEWLTTYTINSKDDLINAKREIMQAVVLAALSRSDFYEKATFYGGTALRIFYNLNRYSEDLDFSLNKPDMNFDFSKYFDKITNEFRILGLDVKLSIKNKSVHSSVESAFIKENTIWGMLTLNQKKSDTSFPSLKIKMEIDKDPVLLFQKEQKLLLKPFSFYMPVMKEESLFAGKVHALLFRSWKSRIKGRDWYDFEWFIKRGTKLDFTHFIQRAINMK